MSTFVSEVNEKIVNCMWNECVTTYMQVTEEDFKKKLGYGRIVAVRSI